MLIALDYDGVVVDSIEQMKKLINIAKPIFGIKHEINIDDLQHIESFTFESIGKYIGLDDAKLPKFKEQVFSLLRKVKGKTKIFSGMPEVIKELAKQYPIVIITSNIEERVDEVIKEYDLQSSVTAIFDGQDSLPKSAKILKAATVYNIMPDQVIMVGDTTSDIKQGKLAGAKTIAVSWGYQTIETLQLAEPDYIASHPKDIFSIVSNLHK